MSTIGIIGAMQEEIEFLKSKMEVMQIKNIINTEFYMGKMYGNSVILVRSGIGKVNAAACTQVLVDMYGIDYIINIGVAGAISNELEIGDIVISSDTVHHDFDSLDGAGVISRMEESFFKGDEELIKLAVSACENTLSNGKFWIERVATGDVFVKSNEAKQLISDNFGAFCTEMEGAAIAQVCYLNKIPFVIIRAISDKADDTSQVSFETFVHEAAEKSSAIVEYIIENMQNI